MTREIAWRLMHRVELHHVSTCFVETEGDDRCEIAHQINICTTKMA
jgi:hypothetical protein